MDRQNEFNKQQFNSHTTEFECDRKCIWKQKHLYPNEMEKKAISFVMEFEFCGKMYLTHEFYARVCMYIWQAGGQAPANGQSVGFV